MLAILGQQRSYYHPSRLTVLANIGRDRSPLSWPLGGEWAGRGRDVGVLAVVLVPVPFGSVWTSGVLARVLRLLAAVGDAQQEQVPGKRGLARQAPHYPLERSAWPHDVIRTSS